MIETEQNTDNNPKVFLGLRDWYEWWTVMIQYVNCTLMRIASEYHWITYAYYPESMFIRDGFVNEA